MRIIFAIIGAVMAGLFVFMLLKGSKFDSFVGSLDEKVFPLAPLYVVGFAWNEWNLFQISKKQLDEYKKQAAALYEPQYAEYYSRVTWAQLITYTHLLLTLTFLAAAILYDLWALVLIGGLFLTVAMYAKSKDGMKNALSARTEECDNELPEVVSTLAILVNSGMVLRDAWTMVAENGEGAFYELMSKATENMRNGMSDADAIYVFGRDSNSTEIKKFTSAMTQSMEKGGGELEQFLVSQSSELWSTKRQKKLQSGEKAATKLLVPIVLIFVGIIIIVMTAAFAGSLF